MPGCGLHVIPGDVGREQDNNYTMQAPPDYIEPSIDALEYACEGLRGKCLAGFQALDLTKIPWDRIKRERVPGFELIKSSHTRRVIKMSFTPEGESKPALLFAKRMRVRRLRQQLGSLFAVSKGKREWILGHRVRSRGIDTPLPVLFAEERRGSRLKASYVVLVSVEGQQSVHDLLSQTHTSSRKSNLMMRSAQFLATLHQKGIYHDDFSCDHLFMPDSSGVTAPEQPALIDLDNAAVCPSPPGTWKRAKNVFQFLRSAPPISFFQKIRFLISYLRVAGIKRSRWRRYPALVNIIARLKKESPVFSRR